MGTATSTEPKLTDELEDLGPTRPSVHAHMKPPPARIVPAPIASPGFLKAGERITGILGAILLAAGLAVWMFKPGQHRLALLVLVCAMFLAILHYYILEEPRSNGNSGV